MTHSLHRIGTSDYNQEDYVFISRPAMGINHEGCAPRIKRSLRIIFEVGPTNLGSLTTKENMALGLDPEDMISKMEDNSPIMCCFHEREKIKEVLTRLKEEDLGLSVVVTGELEDVVELCREVGLKPHSAGISLGIYGKTDLLPEEDVLCFTTMCGHGMVSAGIVKQMKESVKKGIISPEEAANVLSAPCLCGIFNNVKAQKMLEKEREK